MYHAVSLSAAHWLVMVCSTFLWYPSQLVAGLSWQYFAFTGGINTITVTLIQFFRRTNHATYWFVAEVICPPTVVQALPILQRLSCTHCYVMQF